MSTVPKGETPWLTLDRSKPYMKLAPPPMVFAAVQNRLLAPLPSSPTPPGSRMSIAQSPRAPGCPSNPGAEGPQMIKSVVGNALRKKDFDRWTPALGGPPLKAGYEPASEAAPLGAGFRGGTIRSRLPTRRH